MECNSCRKLCGLNLVRCRDRLKIVVCCIAFMSLNEFVCADFCYR